MEHPFDGDGTLAVPVLAPGKLAVLCMPSKERQHFSFQASYSEL
jgi:hypothetical protein